MRIVLFTLIISSCSRTENTKINNYSFIYSIDIKENNLNSGFKYSILESYFKLYYLRSYKLISYSNIDQHLKQYYIILNNLIKATKNFQYPYGILKLATIRETLVTNYKSYIIRKQHNDVNSQKEASLRKSLYKRNGLFNINKTVNLCLKGDWYYCFIILEYNPDLSMLHLRSLLKFFKSKGLNYFRLILINSHQNSDEKNIIIKENDDYVKLVMKYGYNLLIVDEESHDLFRYIFINKKQIFNNIHGLYTFFYANLAYYKELKEKESDIENYKKLFKSTFKDELRYNSFNKHLSFIMNTLKYYYFCNLHNYYLNSIEIINDFFIDFFEGNNKFLSLKINFIELCKTDYGYRSALCPQINNSLKKPEFKKRCLIKSNYPQIKIDLDINNINNAAY